MSFNIIDDQNGQMYQLKTKEDIFSGLGDSPEQISEESGPTIEILQNDCDLDNVSNPLSNLKKSGKNLHSSADVTSSLKNFKLIPLKGDVESTIMKKKKYKSLFHHIFVSQHALHKLEYNPNLLRHLLSLDTDTETFVSIESNKYMAPLNSTAEYEQMSQKIISLARNQGLESTPNTVRHEKLDALKFQFSKRNST